MNKQKKIGRNERCPCGSGLKYKKCHGDSVKHAKVIKAAEQFMLQLIYEECEQKRINTENKLSEKTK